jgi:hypothetical protein
MRMSYVAARTRDARGPTAALPLPSRVGEVLDARAAAEHWDAGHDDERLFWRLVYLVEHDAETPELRNDHVKLWLQHASPVALERLCAQLDADAYVAIVGAFEAPPA